MLKFWVLSFLMASFSIYMIFSYILNWESSKKHWQKEEPYSKFDKTFGISLGIALFILSIFIFVTSL